MSNSYIRQGVSKLLFLPTVVGSSGPDRDEIEAGTDLTDRMADIAGWMLDSTDVDDADWSSEFEKKIPGTTSLPDSSITFRAIKSATDPIKTLLPRGQAGYILIMPAGDIPTGKADLFPVQVRSVGNEYQMGNTRARFVVRFSPTDTPRIDVTIPAA